MHDSTKKIGSIFNRDHKQRKEVTRKRTAQIIGIVGSGQGVGVTHLSILLANYMTGVKRSKTVVLEWNDSGDFKRIEEFCLKKSVLKETSHTFNILEVSYIKKAGKNELLECINHGFDTVIIDFGSDFESVREEFLRCDRKILIGSYCEWRAVDFTELIVRKKSEEGRWELLAAFGSAEAQAEMNRRLHTSVRRIPESSDAFIVTGNIMAFLEGLLK